MRFAILYLAAAIAFAKDVEYVFVPGHPGTAIAKVESVTIDGKPVRFEAIPKSRVCTLIDVYRRSTDGFEFESTGNYVPLGQMLDPALAIEPVLKENVPLRLFKPLLERRVHKAIAIDSRLVRLMYVASGRPVDLGSTSFVATLSEAGLPVVRSEAAANRTIIHEVLGQRPEPLSLIIPVFPLKTSGTKWAGLKRETKAYNGFSFNNATSDWTALVEHARGLLRASAVIQVELPETSSRPELLATIRGTEDKGKRFEVRRRIR